MSGPTTLACVDGTHWNGSTPHCNIITHVNDQPIGGTVNSAMAVHRQNMAPVFMLIFSGVGHRNW